MVKDVLTDILPIEEVHTEGIDLVVSEPANYWKGVRVVVERSRLLAFKYPKLILFIICVGLAIFFFQENFFQDIVGQLENLEYLGIFISGLLFSFGFTTPFATVLLVLMKPENILLAAIIAGLGAAMSDFLIFKFVKISFEDEFKKLREERPFLFVKQNIQSNLKEKHVNYLLIIFAGFFLASPLPDEVGILILTGLTKISAVRLVILGFIFNTIGILFLLLL